MNLNHFYLKLFTKQNVRRQLITLFIFTILIPILLAGSIIYIISTQQLRRNYEHLSESEANRVRSVLVTTTLYLHDIYESIAQDENLRLLLSKDYTSSDEAIDSLHKYTGFEEAMKNTASLTDLKLYVDPKVLQQDTPYSYFYPITNEVKAENWYRQASQTKANFWKSSIRTGQANVTYWELNYYCHIPIPQTGSYAILVLTVSNDYLRNLVQTDGYDIYANVNHDPVFFSSDRSYPGKPFPIALDKKTIASVRSFSPYATSDLIYVLASDRFALPNLHRVQAVFLLVTLFALLISFLLIYLYSAYFSTRIRTLRLAMHKASNNDYEIVNSIQGDDELTATFSDLKAMVIKLKETEAKIYQAQINEQMLSNHQQQMELKLLANQIHPHFLYNTLETIRMKAFSKGDREVATAIKLLGKSMRYVLHNTKTTAATLDKEIDYIRTYLAILKLRFEERINYTIRIEDSLNLTHYQILPLLIQPIVENAINHGLENTEKQGHVILRIHRSGDELLIVDIFDNGAGIGKEQLEDVIAHLTVPQTESEHGVGLYNINTRVRLFYGIQYGLTIKSRLGIGTLVTLTIPLLNLTEEDE